jgi:hypothetical protein
MKLVLFEVPRADPVLCLTLSNDTYGTLWPIASLESCTITSLSQELSHPTRPRLSVSR